MTRENGLKFGAPLTEEEIEALRCLIGSHYYKDIGGRSRACVLCGAYEAEEE